MNQYQVHGKKILSDTYFWICLLLIAIYTIIFTFFSIEKHQAYHSGIDLAVYEHVLWSTINQGTFFSSTLEGVNTFGVHFSPILFALIPVYILHPATETLLVLQTLLLGGAALPLFFIARHFIDDKAGVIVAFSYLMYPALHGVNLTDFHVICFAPLFFFSAFYFLKTENFRLFFLFVLLLACTREDLIPISVMLCVYGAWQAKQSSRDYKTYLIIAGILAAWFLIVIGVIMPALIPAGSSAGGHIFQYQKMMEGFGHYQINRLTHAALLLTPILLLPLLSPDILFIGLPGFLEIFLSPSPYYYSIEYQYSALIIPCLFIATVKTLSTIRNFDQHHISCLYKPILCCLLISGFFCMLLFSPSPLRSGPFSKSYDPTITEHNLAMDEILESIPPDVAIGSQEDILPHISRRPNLYQGFNEKADYIIADNQTKFIDIFHKSANSLASWDIIYSKSGITIFKKPARHP